MAITQDEIIKDEGYKALEILTWFLIIFIAALGMFWVGVKIYFMLQ